MSYIGNSPGLIKRQVFRFIATAGQTSFSGGDVSALTLNYTPGQEDVYLNGFYIPAANYTATTGSTIVFSESLSAGDEVVIVASGAFNPADTLAKSFDGADIVNKNIFRRSIQTTLPTGLSGYVVNPVFEISQENGTNAVGLSTNNLLTYTLDQWAFFKNGSGVYNGQAISGNLASTPSMRSYFTGATVTATTAQASYGTSEFIQPFIQLIEGTNTRDLAWGTPDARSVDLVTIVTATVAGTYAIGLKNAAGDRSYVTTITLAANTPTLIFKTIPGPTSGTWVTNNTSNFVLTIGSVAGTAYQAPSLNAWNNGNYFTSSTCVNWSATTNALITLNFCNMYQNGILPYTETITTGLIDILSGLRRSSDQELRRCQRYYCEVLGHARGNATGTGINALSPIYYPVAMRTIPTAVLKNSGSGTNVGTAAESVASETGGFLNIVSGAAGDFYVTSRKAAYVARL